MGTKNILEKLCFQNFYCSYAYNSYEMTVYDYDCFEFIKMIDMFQAFSINQ